MAKKAYIPEAYDPNQHGSYQSYIINFLSNDSSVASCINPEHNSQEMDLGKMMDECPSPLPFSKLELVANYRKAVQNNELEAWLYYHLDTIMQYWLDAQGQFKPEILAALQGHRIEQQPSLAQLLYQDENGQKDSQKTAVYQGKFIAGMAKNLLEVIAAEITQEILFSNKLNKQDLLAKQIYLPFEGLDLRLYVSPEKMESEFQKRPSRTYLTQFTSDVQVDQTNVITFAKLQDYRQQKDANLLPGNLKFAPLVPEFKKTYNPDKYDSYQHYLHVFLKEDRYVRKAITADKEFDPTRLFNNLKTILPEDINKLWQTYKVAVDSNKLANWVYDMVDRVCQFWLNEQGKFKPEVEQIFTAYRREYFNQAITMLEDRLSRQASNSEIAKDLPGQIAKLKELREQNITEFLYGVKAENKTELSTKVISSIVMNLVGLISAEFSQKAKSELLWISLRNRKMPIILKPLPLQNYKRIANKKNNS
ncbi:MAG: hypothetical protein K0S11_1326 [Gammaproteobacteria bacterium]|nr:hypothetical protein [Gammaproteobacteria bacterium]